MNFYLPNSYATNIPSFQNWFSLCRCVSYWRKINFLWSKMTGWFYLTRFKETRLIVLNVSITSDSLCMDRKKKGKSRLLIEWVQLKRSPVTNWLASYRLRLTYICEPHFCGVVAHFRLNMQHYASLKSIRLLYPLIANEKKAEQLDGNRLDGQSFLDRCCLQKKFKSKNKHETIWFFLSQI